MAEQVPRFLYMNCSLPPDLLLVELLNISTEQTRREVLQTTDEVTKPHDPSKYGASTTLLLQLSSRPSSSTKPRKNCQNKPLNHLCDVTELNQTFSTCQLSHNAKLWFDATFAIFWLVGRERVKSHNPSPHLEPSNQQTSTVLNICNSTRVLSAIPNNLLNRVRIHNPAPKLIQPTSVILDNCNPTRALHIIPNTLIHPPTPCWLSSINETLNWSSRKQGNRFRIRWCVWNGQALNEIASSRLITPLPVEVTNRWYDMTLVPRSHSDSPYTMWNEPRR